MASTRLYRTQGTPTNADKWTFSVWVKSTNVDAVNEGTWMGTYVDSSNFEYVGFNSDKKINFYSYQSGSGVAHLKTNRAFKDPGAWYHFVYVWDTAASATDRMRIYINGVEETSWATDTNPALNLDSLINTSGNIINIGTYKDSGAVANEFFQGVMAHAHFCDGQAYAASDFGSTDATSGIWVPNTGPSVTYGDNGFFLKFASGALGTDSSGNGNTMSVSGTMTPTKDDAQNNFCTGNSRAQQIPTAMTYSNGNLKIAATAAYWNSAYATMGYGAGKWYWETKCAAVGTHTATGITASNQTTGTNTAFCEATTGDNGWAYKNAAIKSWGGDSTVERSYGDTYTTGDVIGCAHDNTNGVIWWSKNGVWQDSATIEEIAAGTTTNAAYSGMTTGLIILPAVQCYGTAGWEYNFGNGYFGTTVAGTETDDAGYGLFKYDVPTGYYAICSQNLATQG